MRNRSKPRVRVDTGDSSRYLAAVLATLKLAQRNGVGEAHFDHHHGGLRTILTFTAASGEGLTTNVRRQSHHACTFSSPLHRLLRCIAYLCPYSFHPRVPQTATHSRPTRLGNTQQETSPQASSRSFERAGARATCCKRNKIRVYFTTLSALGAINLSTPHLPRRQPGSKLAQRIARLLSRAIC